MFKRRNPLSLMAKIRQFFWPKMGWRRVSSYYGMRVKRIKDTPHRIALGFSYGVFVSFTPFFGLHIILGTIMAWRLNGNILASVIGTFLGGNFLTLPITAPLSIKIGALLLGTDHSFDKKWLSASTIISEYHEFLHNILVPFLVGGLPLGIVFAALSYFIVRPAVYKFQHRRTRRISSKHIF